MSIVVLVIPGMAQGYEATVRRHQLEMEAAHWRERTEDLRQQLDALLRDLAEERARRGDLERRMRASRVPFTAPQRVQPASGPPRAVPWPAMLRSFS